MHTFSHPTAKKVVEAYQPIWALGYMQGLSGWDTEVYMPAAGISARGKAQAKVATLSQQLMLSNDFQSALNELEKVKDELNHAERGLLRHLQKEHDYYQKLPASFIEEQEVSVNQAQLSWRKAKQANDFSIFEDDLTRVVSLQKTKAEYLGYQKHPYDALLDLFEADSSTSQLDAYFADIVPFVKDLLKRISKSSRYHKDHPLQSTPYTRQAMEALNIAILETFGYDPDTLRLDTSAHPFTQSLSTQDSRITTWYHDEDFARSYLATIHEFGHALHSLQCSPSLDFSPCVTGASLGVDESQSRFWENFVGRSAEFLTLLLSRIKKLGKDFADIQVEELVLYMNTVSPSLLRIEADEVSYHLHIAIRYELEKQLIDGSIQVADIPEIWNARYSEYLGVAVPDDARGCLQDIHWAFGAFGYFPTYSTGTVLSATWKHELEKDLGFSLARLLEKNDGIESIKKWQKEHVHSHGAVYTFNELVELETGSQFTADAWKDYIRNKYETMYALE